MTCDWYQYHVKYLQLYYTIHRTERNLPLSSNDEHLPMTPDTSHDSPSKCDHAMLPSSARPQLEMYDDVYDIINRIQSSIHYTPVG